MTFSTAHFQGLLKVLPKEAMHSGSGRAFLRDRVIGLDGVLAKLIEFLRVHITPDPACGHRKAFDKIIDMASPSGDELKEINLSKPASSWPCLPNLLSRLWHQYSAVLGVDIPGKPLDYLLWIGLDFRKTFACQEADAEHLAICMLSLEGVVNAIATANWDGLLEAAMGELGYSDDFYKITVTGEDLRGPSAAAELYKFHGCAKRAIENETEYRPLLVARSAQITSWMSNNTFQIVRNQLEGLIQIRRTLMIGMSAQDENIKHLFGAANAQKGWKWSDAPAPIVFCEEELGDNHKNLLNVAYGDAYEEHRTAICEAARVPAYAKPLLMALLLYVLTAKLLLLATEVQAPNLDETAYSELADGIKFLRDRVAIAGNGDKLSLAKNVACGLARARHQLQDGASPAGVPRYYPIDNEPAHRMKGKLSLRNSGQREAAAALGLIGLDEMESIWASSSDDPSAARSGALRLTSSNGSARVFFAANDDNITNLLDCGAFDDDSDDVVVICSRRVVGPQQRSPSNIRRDGKIGLRFVELGQMLVQAANLGDLRERFREEFAL